MTSLRAFQSEIEDIHSREIAKQRAQAAAPKEKENKSPVVRGKAKDVDGNADIVKKDAIPQKGTLETEEGIQASLIYIHLRRF
jgi:hypothetical protein